MSLDESEVLCNIERPDQKKEIEIRGVKTVKELLDTLDKMFPEIKRAN